ncbi:MAG: preprotein translocase subunit YajC [Anaerolineaceae bacterium]|nr:MAG: preprotein translocase subunit YajC [Anaerolineaceae bacterium]
MQDFALLAFVLLLALGAWWSLVTFPKQRDFSKRQQFARSLAEGDEVITYGGIIGKVQQIDAEKGIAYVEIADGVVLRIITAALMQPYDEEEIAENARRGLQRAGVLPEDEADEQNAKS